ncbi:11117_t:CDS:2, partial [Ambispora gerdemannii]
MESSNFKDILVLIGEENGEKAKKECRLDLSANLYVIRKYLKTHYNIKMGTNAFFISKRGGELSRKDEEKKLGEIIIIENENHIVLKIIIKTKLIDWEQIIENCKLEYGFELHNKNDERPTKKKQIFQFKKYPEDNVLEQSCNLISNSIECHDEADILRVNNNIAKLNVGTNIPWLSICASLGISIDSKKKLHKSNQTSTVYWYVQAVRATIDIPELDAQPTDAFKEAVQNALSKNTDQLKRKALKEVANEFGPFWSKRVLLGGKKVFKENEQHSLNELQNTKENSGSSSINGVNSEVFRNRTLNTTQNTGSKYSYLKVYGGDYNEDESEWIKSLKNYKKWCAIEYKDIALIFEILNEDTRNEIFTLFGPAIVKSDVENIEFDFHKHREDPCVIDFPRKEFLQKSHRIFANVINKRNPEEIFALRLHYNYDSNTPQIVLHRLGKRSKGDETIRYSLQLAWVVIGHTYDFLFNSGYQIICDEVINGETKELEEDPKNGLIMTCLTQVKPNCDNHDPTKSDFFVGSYFFSSNSKIKSCGFGYKVNDTDKKLDLKLVGVDFKINYCVLVGNNNYHGMRTLEKVKATDGIVRYNLSDEIQNLITCDK